MHDLWGQLAQKRHVIWDWNGTLLDDVEHVVAVMGALLDAHDLPALSTERYRTIFGFPVVEYYQKLGFDFEKTPFPTLADAFIERYEAGVLACDLHQGSVELLRTIRAAGIEQSVLSAAHEGSLRAQLVHYGILDCFDRVYGLSDVHARGKLERGRELLAETTVPLADTVLVGDTDHDLEVGRALGIDVLLLGDGHQAHERLAALHDRVLTR